MPTLSRRDWIAGPARMPRTSPRLTLRGIVAWLLALDVQFRERADLAAMDERTLRDIGVSRSEVTEALRRPDEHLRLILLRGGH